MMRYHEPKTADKKAEFETCPWPPADIPTSSSSERDEEKAPWRFKNSEPDPEMVPAPKQKGQLMLEQLLSQVPSEYSQNPLIRDFAMYNMTAFMEQQKLVKDIMEAKDGHRKFMDQFYVDYEFKRHPSVEQFEALRREV
jgi:hypothetical protein